MFAGDLWWQPSKTRGRSFIIESRDRDIRRGHDAAIVALSPPILTVQRNFRLESATALCWNARLNHRRATPRFAHVISVNRPVGRRPQGRSDHWEAECDAPFPLYFRYMPYLCVFYGQTFLARHCSAGHAFVQISPSDNSEISEISCRACSQPRSVHRKALSRGIHVSSIRRLSVTLLFSRRRS